MKVIVIGAGLAGATIAERFASHGHKVEVFEARNHIAGNAYDELDEHGILVHRYGPHIFHTSREDVFSYLSKFTYWRLYEHRVRASIEGTLYPFPINLDTINAVFGLQFSEKEAEEWLDTIRCNRNPVLTSEDVVLNAVGPVLCDLFYRGYTRKAWGKSLAELDASVTRRIPVRLNHDDRYFSDLYQAMPEKGYTEMVGRMLKHPNIAVYLNSPMTRQWVPEAGLVFCTAPIDAFYGYALGKLPYRSLRFEFEHFTEGRFQPVGTVNYPMEHEYTRITEFRHLTGQEVKGTTIVREYPQDEGDPFYPIPAMHSRLMHDKYVRFWMDDPLYRNIHFVGRLGEYRYYNMDEVVHAALCLAGELV